MPTTQASPTDIASSATRQVEPIVGTLRVVGGTRLADASPCATALSAPPGAARTRESERLFVLLELIGPAPSHLYRELRELVSRTYWSATGSITGALRQAATVANRHLFHTNLRATPADRCAGGLTCAVYHDDDLFILQAGLTRACLFRTQEKHLTCFSRGQDPAPMGTGQLVDVRLYHSFVAPGDTLLLASSALVQDAGEEAIARVLPRLGVPQVLDGLEQVGAGTEFVALVARWELPSTSRGGGDKGTREQGDKRTTRQGARAREQRPSVTASASPPSLTASASRPSPTAPASRPSPTAPARVGPGLAANAPPRRPPTPRPRTRPKPARYTSQKLVPGLGKLVGGGARALWRGIVAASTGLVSGIVTVGKGLAGGSAALFRRMLPGQEREARRRTPSRRPVPKENRTVMIALAIGIPVVLAIVATLAYFSFGGEDAHFQRLINQAQKEITLAQTGGGMSQEARPHWESALDRANAAVKRRPDDPVAMALQAQARAALDFLDGIIRLQPIQLWDFGPSSGPRQLIVHGQTIFVLDTTEGWVAQLTLTPGRDGVVESGDIPAVLQSDQEIEGKKVGTLAGFAWVDAAGERQTSGLLILEEDGALISYDPAWVGEGGDPRFTRSLLGTPPVGSPRSVDSFGGRLYILDPEENQILRYEPRGITYPEQPERYFVTAPPKSLETALDIAIDGNIYILYTDGTLLKFLQREQQPFDVNGLFDETSHAVALAVDPHSNSGTVYVADQGSGCVVGLGPEGALRARFCADEAFNALEAVAADEAAGRLYALSEGRLYAASLP